MKRAIFELLLYNMFIKKMNMKLLLGALLLFVCSLTGCSDDDNNGSDHITPFSLEKTYYEVRLGRGVTDIPITNGSGDISLSVADETMIEANKVLNEGGGIYVFLQGKKKGTTTLTLTDNVTEDKETVEVKVTDCYIAYGIAESNHPTLTSNLMLYLVNNEARDCYFFSRNNLNHQLYNTPLAKGTYEFLVKTEGEEKVPYLRLNYPADESGNWAQDAPMEAHDFALSFNDSQIVLEIIKGYLNVDWEELISNATTKSVPPRDYSMIMTVPDTEYEIIGAFATASIPEGVLD